MPSAAEQAERNREILVARARGDAPREIAQRHGLSPTRVRQILAQGVALLPDERRIDPVQVAYQRRAQYEALFEKIEELADQIPPENASPKVGALRLCLHALDRACAWDQIIGLLPSTLPEVWHETDTRETSGRILDVLEAEGTSPETIDRLINELDPSDKAAPSEAA